MENVNQKVKFSKIMIDCEKELNEIEKLKKEAIEAVIYDYEIRLTPSEYLCAVEFMKKYKRKTDPKRILELSYNHFTGIAKIKVRIRVNK